MKPIRAVIIEDEALTAEKLLLLTTKVNVDVKVMAVLESVAASVNWLSKNKVDLIFMDIHLSDGKAFEIFEQINVITPIVFVTAYDQYAIEAFKEYSIDYLLKPISIKDLDRALQKFNRIQSQGQHSPQYDLLLERLQQQGQNRFLVNVGKSIKAIDTEKIAYFYAESKMVFMVDEEGKSYLMDQTLEKLNQLTPSFFFRVNRKCLINIKKIQSIHNHSYSRLIVIMNPKTSFDLIVPLERVGDFKNCLIKE